MRSSRLDLPVILDFDTRIFSLTAVKRAAYEFGEKCEIIFSEIIDGQFKLTITFEHLESTEKKALIKMFRQSVLDNQVRIDVEKDYGAIRRLIVAQAFHPCDNLTEIIDALEL